jgi:hypothetical protein
MIDNTVVELIRTASHGDAFSVLGMHADAKGSLWVQALHPGAPFGEITAQPRPSHGRPCSIELALPPPATESFQWNP